MARQQKIEYEVTDREAVYLYFSLLNDDCLARRKAMFVGGIRYLAGTLDTYGNNDVADALTAVNHTVFREKTLSMKELLAAMDSDWSSAEAMRLRLLTLPKYDNDDVEADEMAVRIHEHVCRFTRDQARIVGLDYYLVVIINNELNVRFGQLTAALPDGRHACTPLANGNNPVAGRDRRGTTAFLQSLLKLVPTIHA